jgi:hypothetical protein
MQASQTEADFEGLSWHDCHIWRIDMQVGDPDEGDWTSDLVFGIDFIAEWLCGVDGKMRFKVAPATLAFHGVTDPKITINWGDSGLQVAIHPLSIGQIVREPVSPQKVYLDRPYYRWQMLLNWPAGGEIEFGAVGFTQTLLAEPIVCEKQHLSLMQRSRLFTPGR